VAWGLVVQVLFHPFLEVPYSMLAVETEVLQPLFPPFLFWAQAEVDMFRQLRIAEQDNLRHLIRVLVVEVRLMAVDLRQYLQAQADQA
jgi:hypothetical protein